jgi:hypothetical protein
VTRWATSWTSSPGWCTAGSPARAWRRSSGPGCCDRRPPSAPPSRPCTTRAWERTSGPPQQRLADIADKLRAWGLQDPTHIEAKIDFLRSQGLPEDFLRHLHADLSNRRLAGPTGTSFLTPDTMIHVLYPEKPGGTKTLVGGAHLDSSLHAHEAGNLTERYIPTAEKPAGNTTYRRYAQLKWKGSGPAPPIGDPRTPTPLPPGAPGYPGLNITPAQAGLWDVAPDPKTTFDNPALQMERGIERRCARGGLGHSRPRNGQLHGGQCVP